MRVIIFSLLLVAFFSFKAFAGPDCVKDCTYIMQTTDGSHAVVVLDKNGGIFKVIPIDLGQDATEVSSSNIPSINSNPSSDRSGSVEMTQVEYTTATEKVVVITAVYYDALDNVQDVKITVPRFPKSEVPDYSGPN
ncbi:hypothetical protein [Microbulbifer spongiae]|uniref:Uncharacterized protein n=1 Tax=Microbulbifer spongiae TaxID=2944933 RepID=A0ABY9E8W0_9GAMM|nr:hypothetical protein [Microbulbifer sp. MI-G]WKD48761.1 hypothetical protein M8T91_12680 [Microbulbifer sp. MI-G]